MTMMREGCDVTLRYRVVDVFSSRPLSGNPLAVFPESHGLDGTTMQAIARELNLSETTFVLPSSRHDCVARVRIFTPAREIAFAGHPTLGTAFVLRDQGAIEAGVRGFSLEEGVGPVTVEVGTGAGPMLWLRTPEVAEGRLHPPEVCARALGLVREDLSEVPPQTFSAGNPTIFVALGTPAAVDRAWLDLAGARSLRGDDPDPSCVFVFARTDDGAYSRMFAPEYGISEDPASGSSTGPLAVFMMRNGLLPAADGTSFVSEQGVRMGRRSLLHVRIRGDFGADGILVGGDVAPVATGVMQLRIER
jgi:trans-2,3-dihydro-3-hydroxyanthranilate isomerase